MAEYIEREALITLIEDKHTEGYELCMPMKWKAHYVAGLQKAKQFVERAPAADVVEVKCGYWEEYWDDDYMESFHRCSECRNDAPAKRDTYCDQVLTNYCPNCGAKMDLKEGAEE